MIALKDFKKLIKRASQPMARGDETDARQRGEGCSEKQTRPRSSANTSDSQRGKSR